MLCVVSALLFLFLIRSLIEGRGTVEASQGLFVVILAALFWIFWRDLSFVPLQQPQIEQQ